MKIVTDPVEVAERAVAEAVAAALAAGPVLWLVSGGSCVRPQVAIMRQLHHKSSELLRHLTILPVDERYGPAGHAVSNHAQMAEAGFDPGSAFWPDVLQRDMPLEQTVAYYEQLVRAALGDSVIKPKPQAIATLGIGGDGHTSGLLPHSPALISEKSLVVGYEWTDYVRLTTGSAVFLQIARAFVLAYGAAKQPALERLVAHRETLQALPASLLYALPEVTIYNDGISREV